jgi:MOSC domain-containing protein YiiM
MTEARVTGLAVAPENGAPLQRDARQMVEFVEGKGVQGDKNFGKRAERGVNLVSQQSYDWFKRSFNRERPLPGGFGEQVVISGEIDPNWLDLRQRIQIGDAILQVVTPRTPCDGFTTAVDGDKISYFVGHVGVMCAVVKSGKAAIGDPVRLV